MTNSSSKCRAFQLVRAREETPPNFAQHTKCVVAYVSFK